MCLLRQANALHHRSDGLSSAVTFLAIGGSWLGFPVLDPLGGLLVAGLIGKQGADLLIGALGELSDRGVEPEVLRAFDQSIRTIHEAYPDLLVGWKELRAVKSGVSTFVDVTLQMPPQTRLEQARDVEGRVREAVVKTQKGVSALRCSFAPARGRSKNGYILLFRLSRIFWQAGKRSTRTPRYRLSEPEPEREPELFRISIAPRDQA